MAVKRAVVFPGIGYHSDKPLLYYAKKLAAQAGYEITEVCYYDMPKKILGNANRMRLAYETALSQAEETLCGLDLASCEDVLFISKSIGTLIAAGYAKKHGINVKQLMYTPLLETFSFLKEGKNCIIFHGSDDPWADCDEVSQMCLMIECPSYLYEGGNHSIETGAALKDLKNLSEIMMLTAEFIRDAGVRLPEDHK